MTDIQKCEHQYDHNGECLKCDEPMSEWIGLTDEERFTANYNLDPYKHALEIEAKLKEKNT